MKLTQNLAGLVVAAACITGTAAAQDVSLSYGEPTGHTACYPWRRRRLALSRKRRLLRKMESTVLSGITAVKRFATIFALMSSVGCGGASSGFGGGSKRQQSHAGVEQPRPCSAFDGHDLEHSYNLGFKHPINCIGILVWRNKDTADRVAQISFWSKDGTVMPKMMFPVAEKPLTNADLRVGRTYEVESTFSVSEPDESESVSTPRGTVQFEKIANEDDTTTAGVIDIASFDRNNDSTLHAGISFSINSIFEIRE